MTRLSIGVSKYLEGEESLATGRIVAIDEGSTEPVRVPVGRGRFVEVDVEPGRYLVQVDMPFGMPLSRTITVAEGEAIRRIELDGPHSDHEWLSWSNFSTGAGAAGSTLRRLDFSPALEARRVASLEIELWVGSQRVALRSGSRRLTLGGVEFNITIDSDWPNLVARIGTLSEAPDMRQVPRTILVARTGAERKFITVPVPWINHQAPGDSRRAVDVLISETTFDPDADPGTPQPSLAVTVRDPVFAAVFGYLAGGNPSAALRVGGDLRSVALKMIEEKVMNPYAAAGAAYLLLRSESNVSGNGLPQQWLLNLAQWFPWLPDGMVLAGWHLLRTSGEPSEARNYLLTATRRGIPVYTEGVRLLIESLSMLPRGGSDAELDSALKRARQYGARVDPAAPFTIGPAQLLQI